MANSFQVEEASPPVSVWCGDYRFGRDDSFFPSMVRAARTYVDPSPEKRPVEALFRDELGRLRRIAPRESAVLLDQIEHRWTHPDCPPALYALTCTLIAPDGGALLNAHGEQVREMPCTKIGQATHTVAARIERYRWDVLNRLRVVPGSPTLRTVVFGSGSVMPLERDIKNAARTAGSRVVVLEPTGVERQLSTEVFAGVELADAICAFARSCINPV